MDDLRSGYRLKSEPEPPASVAETIEQPERVAPPERPPETVAERKTISREDILAGRKESVAAMVKSLREQGVRRTINALFYTTPGAILAKLLGRPGYAAMEIAMAPAILAGSHVLANLLDRPEVVSWISKVTPKDLALINDLPAEQKAIFTQNLGELVKDAQKRKLPVSRALTALVVGGGATASTPKTLQQLRKEALRLQQQQAASDTTQPTVEEPTQTQPEQTEPETNEPVEEEEPEP